MTDTENTRVKDVTAKDLRLVCEEFAALLVKVLFAMNGAAALAVMAFIGTDVAEAYLQSAVSALAFFAVGVLMAAGVSGLSFLAARNYYEAKKHANDPIQKGKDRARAERWYLCSRICAVVSWGTFFLGAGTLCWSILTAHVCPS